MSVQGDKFKEIADAIREKDKTTEPISANTFASRIRALKGGLSDEELGLLSEQIDKLIGPYILPTSAKYFTFNGNAVTGYNGTDTDIIIPQTYSLDESGNPTDGTDYSVTSIEAKNDNSGFTTIGSITLLNNITNIGRFAFNLCIGLTKVSLPLTLKNIGDNAFQYCYNLTSIEFPSSITNIGNQAFESCRSLSTITIPYGMTSIDDYAFGFCIGLISITIPSSITNILPGAFQGCTSLTNITLPNSITNISGNVFYGCTNLTEITILATTPPTLVRTSAISTATTIIYIPKGTLSAYQSATNWSSFADKFVELP